MASHSTPKSDFEKTVCLADWWLVKAETEGHGNQLAVAGFTSREKQAMRFFSSAPILKRYDLFTLQTADGICVILNGFINKAHTVENGFPPDVFNHFVFGFPPHWKEYSKKFMGKESLFKDTSGVKLVPEKRLTRSQSKFTLESPFKDTSGVNLVREKRLTRSQRGPVDKMKSKDLDAQFELISEMPSLDKDLKEVKTKGNMQKAKTRAAASLSAPAVNTDKISLSEKVKASVMKTRRKLAYETPEREKKKASGGSPQSSSLNRSRSGRLLMPTLEFWRNQIAIYNVDRTITGIQDDDAQTTAEKRKSIYATEKETDEYELTAKLKS